MNEAMVDRFWEYRRRAEIAETKLTATIAEIERLRATIEWFRRNRAKDRAVGYAAAVEQIIERLIEEESK